VSSLDLLPASAARDERQKFFELYCASLRQHIEPAFGWDLDLQRRRFDQEYPSGNVSIVMFEGRRAGFLSVDPRSESVHVSLLLLEPEFQGLGIGRRVMDRVWVQSFEEQRPVTLSCFRSNQRALRFYEGIGFEVRAVDEYFVNLIRLLPQSTAAGGSGVGS
jgi:ribosomal protein S18 acetylase RimI-like enzyme